MFPARTALVVIALSIDAVSCSSSSTSATTTAAVTAIAATSTTTATPRMHEVLVTNDDGSGAPGINAICQYLSTRSDMHVSVLAPLTNQSGAGGFGSAEQVDDIDAFDAGHPVVTQIDPTTLIGVVVTPVVRPKLSRRSPEASRSLPKPPEASGSLRDASATG